MKRFRDLAAGIVLGAMLASGAVAVAAANEQANCSYAGGPMDLCQLATLAQGLLDSGYAPETPVMRAVAGDPTQYGVEPLILRATDWIKPEGVVPLAARGYYQRHVDSGSVTALIIR